MNVKDFIAGARRNYALKILERKAARNNPFEQFELWLAQALENDLHEPYAMTLATASASGKPSARIVLLRGFSADGFIFYTNYDSRKGRNLAENPQASLLFYWAEAERQVRIEGLIAKVESETSDRYFASRPRESQIGAWVSPQSRTIENRAVLEQRFTELDEKWRGKEIPRPDNWGGYILQPDIFEFWQGRENRLHDRLLYRKNKSGWKIERIAP